MHTVVWLAGRQGQSKRGWVEGGREGGSVGGTGQEREVVITRLLMTDTVEEEVREKCSRPLPFVSPHGRKPV